MQSAPLQRFLRQLGTLRTSAGTLRTSAGTLSSRVSPRYIHMSTVAKQKEVPSSAFHDDLPVEMDNPFEKEKVECILCKMRIDPDYKNVRLLSQFVSPFTGRIYGRHITGLCKKKQERVVTEIRKSQYAGFMPYYNKEAEFLEDPKLFNPDRPIRNHDF